MLGVTSVSQFKDFFWPVMRTVIKALQMLPSNDKWETAHLANELGVQGQELASILEGHLCI